MLRVKITQKQRKVLHLDIETRRVGFFTGGRFNPDGCEPIAIAVSWAGDEKVYEWDQGTMTLREMARWFRCWWDEADVVSGHYIRKFDLPVLNGMYLELQEPPLPPKDTIDTKMDLRKRGGLGVGQENLADLFRLEERKFPMSDAKWRRAARLSEEGLADARVRVIDDVKQHKAIHGRLCHLGWMRPMKTWTP